MAKVTIGGHEYEVPEMNFAALERAWPYVAEAMVLADPIKGVSACICIIGAGLCEAENFVKTQFGIADTETLGEDQTFQRVVRFLKKKIKAKEVQGIRDAVDKINEEAGLEPITGEAPGTVEAPGTEESRSQETAPTSSPNLSQPDVREQAGA